MTAHHFVLTDLETGALIGHALLCAEARYVGVRSVTRDDHVSHRGALIAEWPSIAADLRLGWEKGLVDGESATGRALISPALRGQAIAQRMTELVTDLDAERAREAFDRYLMTQVFGGPAR